MNMPRRALLTLAGYAALGGCSALSAVSQASEPLDAFTLSPLGPLGDPGGRSGHLIVELPTSGGALATDRILIKPDATQAQYLPAVRWSDQTPALVQTLLVGSLLNRSAFRLVGRTAAGLRPDYTLMTEIQEFQAQVTGLAENAPVLDLGPQVTSAQVRITMQMTLIRESDLSIAGARRFSATAAVNVDDTPGVIAGFDSAMQTMLGEVVAWLLGLT